jgi:hypothetical protein
MFLRSGWAWTRLVGMGRNLPQRHSGAGNSERKKKRRRCFRRERAAPLIGASVRPHPVLSR